MADTHTQPATQPSLDEVEEQSAYEGRRPDGGSSSTEKIPPSRPAGGQSRTVGDDSGADDPIGATGFEQHGFTKGRA